jgi:Tfp pilus assembly protein PilN
MIRTNLSTRPFYNDRVVYLLIGLVALAAVAATAFNVSRALYDLRSDTDLKMQAARDEARVAEINAEAARLRASVDTSQVAVVSAEARHANELIDRRTFSWTELLGRFETTLPPSVRLTSVQPSIGEDRRVALAIAIVARRVEDVDEFMRSMEQTGSFTEVLSREERVNEEGELEASVSAVYLSRAAEGPAPGGSP